jgi:hypothetical protein
MRPALLFLVLSASVLAADTFPNLQADALSGRHVSLPADSHGRIALVVIGFSRNSQKATDAWRKRFESDFTPPRFAVYPVAVLEAAPRMIRGFITGSMKKGMSPADQDRYLILVHDEGVWKQRVKFSAEDDAYLFLVDADGSVRWQASGPFREDLYAPLRDIARRLTK